jgi:2',3'-cyclic-nucleotide 2'-phosphodiesterase (5'-nucleotidase family)
MTTLSPRSAVALVALSLWACSTPPPAAKPAAPAVIDAGAPAAAPVTVTLLLTGSEAGRLTPVTDAEGVSRGGVAEALGRWVRDEGHCPGPLGKDGASACGSEGSTLVLSTGDNSFGSAVSTAFAGEPMARALFQLGYAASAFGNHELDFGKDGFLKVRELSGIRYLAANVKATDEDGRALGLPATATFTRRGQAITVIGLTAPRTAQVVKQGFLSGADIVEPEGVLAQAVPKAWSDGADAVVVVSDGCLKPLAASLDKHPEWKVSVAAARRCWDNSYPTASGGAELVWPGRYLEQYARVSLTFNPGKAKGERLSAVTSQLVDVINDAAAPPPEPNVKKLVDGWVAKADGVLGEVLGVTKAGLAGDKLEAFVLGALREEAKADVAVFNKRGLRGELKKGNITRLDLYGVMPFENAVLTVKLTGAQLATLLTNDNAIAAGVKRGPKGLLDAKGKPVDGAKLYTVVTTDFAYFGGDGLDFQNVDVTPTGEVWQTPVISWTRRNGKKLP